MNYTQGHDNSNFPLFRDCFSSVILQRASLAKSEPTRKHHKRRASKNQQNNSRTADQGSIVVEPNEDDAEELSDFLAYLALEVFAILPKDLQTLSYSAIRNNPRLMERYVNSPSSSMDDILLTIPTSVRDSFETYALLPPSLDLSKVLALVVTDYTNAATLPPPVWSNTRTTACEICCRDWIPLTYHHLIPKQIHAKALKRHWHEEWRLSSVAWLCRACHSFVHRIASNEELARDWWSVKLLLSREDVQAWTKWASRIRWKSR